VPDYDPYHFPPELMDLLIETIPRLCKSKLDVLAFFRGCGVPDSTTDDLRARLAADRDSINKFHIARNVLARINEGGDGTLAQRRQVLKRVTEFSDFSACWERDQLEARGLVASIRDVVNVKDSFTRINQEREAERRQRLRRQEAEAEAKQHKRRERDELRRKLASLTSMTNPQQRGLDLESVLNGIFKLDGLSVRESFALRNEDGVVYEQIDGLIALSTQLILVEAKWHAHSIGKGDVSSHLVRLFTRSGAYGLFISASPFTGPAIEVCKSSLANLVVVLAEVHELLMLLEDPDASVSEWLQAKITAATVDRQPLFRPLTVAVP
jgi:restriction system protein